MPCQQSNLCLIGIKQKIKTKKHPSHEQVYVKRWSKDIWQGSLEWLEQGFYLFENLERN